MILKDSTSPSMEKASTPDIKIINGQDLKKLVDASITWLRSNQQLVNSLNVFPVPDGDTGTNMLLTMQSAWSEITELDDLKIGRIAHAISQGALMGARGNSGVILSQLWRGFARILDDLEFMDSKTFVLAINESRNTAYKGVVRPVEGTILTVAKDIAAAVENSASYTDNLFIILKELIKAADISVQKTPELLPILKQAGVVDSGGKGLYFMFEGMLRFIEGQSLEASATIIQPLALMDISNTLANIEPGQDYEVIIDFQPKKDFQLDTFYEKLSQIGTSIQIGEGDGMYRMHIHVPTEKRYDPIDYTMTQGTVTKIAIENLIDQMQEIGKNKKNLLEFIDVKPNQVAVVAVSPGMGMSRIFASLGVSAIVEGGQTMNPSTEEILNAVNDLPTDKVIILPNNKNIILAAQSAAGMATKKVKVIPSLSVPQGLSAILRLDPDGDLDDLAKKMTDSLLDVETGEITTATRSVDINGVNVKKGQVLVLHNGQLIGSFGNLTDACMEFLSHAGVNERERITFFYGNHIEKPMVDDLVNKIRERFPQHEIEIHEGGQPYYQYVISLE
jgi:DAK2 domain fusion protein YloV